MYIHNECVLYIYIYIHSPEGRRPTMAAEYSSTRAGDGGRLGRHPCTRGAQWFVKLRATRISTRTAIDLAKGLQMISRASRTAVYMPLDAISYLCLAMIRNCGGGHGAYQLRRKLMPGGFPSTICHKFMA